LEREADDNRSILPKQLGIEVGKVPALAPWTIDNTRGTGLAVHMNDEPVGARIAPEFQQRGSKRLPRRASESAKVKRSKRASARWLQHSLYLVKDLAGHTAMLRP
jgi:hypothetical protein